MHLLPEEIIGEILSFLNPEELHSAYLVSKAFYQNCDSKILWKFYVSKFLSKTFKEDEEISYKKFYIEAWNQFLKHFRNGISPRIRIGYEEKPVLLALVEWHRTYEILFDNVLATTDHCSLHKALIRAVEKGNKIYVRSLLKMGVDVYQRCGSFFEGLNNTVLDIACKNGNASMITILLEHVKPNMERLYLESESPLMNVIKSGNVDALKALLVIESAEEDFLTRRLIHEAIASESLEMVRYFTSIFGNEILDLKDQEGNTTLHSACKTNSLDIIQYIVSLKPDFISERNILSELPINLACKYSSAQVVEYILRSSNYLGLDWKLLLEVINLRHLDVAKILLSHMNRTMFIKTKKNMVLNAAFKTYDKELIMEVLKRSRVDCILDDRLETPLHRAAAMGFEKAMKYIIKRAPKLVNYYSYRSLKDKSPVYPLDFAVVNQHVGAVSILLKYGAYIESSLLRRAYYNKAIHSMLIKELRKRKSPKTKKRYIKIK